MTAGLPSVFLAALGEDAASLHPEVRAYAAGAAADADGVMRVTGVFDVAGSRWDVLLRVVRPLLGPGAVITRRGRGVPFVLVNRHRAGPRGEPVLAATRTLRFRCGAETFSDVLEPGPARGTLRNRLGARGRLELLLRCEPGPTGGLRLRSVASSVRLGGPGRIRIPLPRLLGVEALLEQDFDDASGRHRISARARNPILGTVLEYRGTFTVPR